MQPAGARDKRITLRKHGRSYDAHNQPIGAWTYLAEVWSSWRRATSRERLASGQAGAQVTDIFEIVWTPAVSELNPKDRLEFKGLTYDIVDAAGGRAEGNIVITAAARSDLEG